MNIAFTWAVTGLKTRTEGDNQDAVVQTYWKKIGTDENGHTGEFIGATPFTSVNVPAGEFVPFAQLTEEMVLSWIKAVVVGSYEEHVNGVISKQIADKASPITDTPMPWAPVVEAPAVNESPAA